VSEQYINSTMHGATIKKKVQHKCWGREYNEFSATSVNMINSMEVHRFPKRVLERWGGLFRKFGIRFMMYIKSSFTTLNKTEFIYFQQSKTQK